MMCLFSKIFLFNFAEGLYTQDTPLRSPLVELVRESQMFFKVRAVRFVKELRKTSRLPLPPAARVLCRPVPDQTQFYYSMVRPDTNGARLRVSGPVPFSLTPGGTLAVEDRRALLRLLFRPTAAVASTSTSAWLGLVVSPSTTRFAVFSVRVVRPRLPVATRYSCRRYYCFTNRSYERNHNRCSNCYRNVLLYNIMYWSYGQQHLKRNTSSKFIYRVRSIISHSIRKIG